jgi:hypothetical protein
MARYVVIGPGWGSTPCFVRSGGYLRTLTGHVVYEGDDRDAAEAALDRAHRRVVRLKRNPLLRNVVDTYQLITIDD